jgi:energy-coupling factor transporter ATP-binding protein EcfA2
MRLRSLRIRNFRAIDDLPLDLTDDFGNVRPLLVLAGPNGSGKTSVLFAIAQSLRRVMGYRTDDVPDPSLDDVRQVDRRDDRWYSSSAPSTEVELELEFSDAELRLVPELARTVYSVSLPDLPSGRLRLAWSFPPGRLSDGSERPWWHVSVDPWHGAETLHWLKGRQLAIKVWGERRTRPQLDGSVLYDYLCRIGGLYLFPQDRNLRQRVIGEGESSAQDREHHDVSDDDGDRRRVRGIPSVAGALEYFSQYVRNRTAPLPDERNWEKRIQDGFRRICGPKEYLGYLYRGDDPTGAPCFRDGEHIYPLHMAASGEQVIMEYLTRLTYPSPLNQSIVLVDEPEIHLHPGWVRQFYLALPEIGENNQYLLTTHSGELRNLAASDGSLVSLGALGEGQ